MNDTTQRPLLGSVPRVLAALVAAMMLLALAPLVGTADAAIGEIEVSEGDGLVPSARFRGDDRFDTSQLIATDDTDFAAEYAGDALIIARGDVFADALTGSVLGGSEEAPIVLTPRDTSADGGELNSDVKEAVDAYADTLTDIYILGGVEAVGPSVEEALGAYADANVDGTPTITRLGGESRFETAQLIADVSMDAADTAIVADGGNFPDALVSGALAAGAGIPILLNGSDGAIDPFTQQAIDDLGVENVVVAGGTDAISASLYDAFAAQADAERVSGEDRFATAVAFARYEVENYDFGTEHFNLARADEFPDALALGPHAGLDFAGPSPILLTAVDDFSQQTADYFSSLAGCDTQALHVAGGYLAITPEVETAARTVLTQPGDICQLELTPETATNVVGDDHTVTATPLDNAGQGSMLTETSTVTFEVLQIESATAETVTATDDNTAVPTLGTGEIGPNADAADFTFTSYAPGNFEITATTTGANDETVTATARKTFVLPDEAALPTGARSAALAFGGGTGFGTLTATDGTTTAAETQTAFVGDAAGDAIVGLDYRPNDQNDDGADLAGVLYALGTSGQLYTVDGDGVAAAIGDGTGIAADLPGGVGFDFNPEVDKIRVVLGAGDENYVVDPDTGAQVADSPFTPAAYAAGDANAGAEPEVSAVGYSSSGLLTDGSGPDATVEYAIDTATDSLVVKAKNAGTLSTVGVGDLGVGDVANVNGFDVVQGEDEGSPDVGFAVLQTTDGTTAYYAIDLVRGEVIGDGVALPAGFAPPVTGFSVVPTA